MSQTEKNAMNPVQVFSDPLLFSAVADEVFYWALARNITEAGGATSLSQIKKLKEEAEELEEALISGDTKNIQLELGDVIVVLLNICRLSGVDLTDCLESAFEKIKDRKGKMIDGVFVKEEDLNGV